MVFTQNGTVKVDGLSHVRVIKWLKHHDGDQHGLSSKPTRTILLCPWERLFMTLSLLGGLANSSKF